MAAIVTRRYVLSSLAASVLGTVAGLSACASQKTPQTAAVAQLTVSTWGSVDELRVRKELLQQFQKAHSDVRISFQPVDFGHFYDKLQTQMAGGDAPDLFYVGADHFPAFVAKNVLLPISPFISRDKYSLTDFWPGPLQEYAAARTQYGLPRGVAADVLFYNVDLFRKMGVTPPPVQWTDASWNWQTFVQRTKQLTQGSGNEKAYGYAINTSFYGWEPWVLQNSGTILSPDLKNCTMTDPKTVEALQFLQDLVFKYHVSPTPAELTTQNAFQLFSSGKIGLTISIRAALSQFQAIKGFTWDLAPFPRGTAGAATALQGVGYCLFKGTKFPDQDWGLLRFLSSTPAEQKEMQTGTVMPARISVCNSKEFLKPPPAHAEIFLTAMQYAHKPPLNPQWTKVINVFSKELSRLWDNSASAASVCQRIVTQVNGILQSTTPA
ncbi:MAG: sugar ABC transporter substrate-binding protein [Chloroflexi bacterium]|nr:sugar ABC transporter substrate-binding protein [Chloroflexota bacterium]